MKKTLLISIILYSMNIFGIENVEYQKKLLKRIYDNRSHIEKIIKNCNEINRAQLLTDSCTIENEDWFLNLLESPFNIWQNHQNKVIDFIYLLKGTNALLLTKINNSSIINDSIYIHILAGYLGLQNDTIKKEVLNIFLNKTAYTQLKKNSNVIKSGIKMGDFENSSDQKEKALKLLALLNLTIDEKKNLIEENLLTKKLENQIKVRIKQLKKDNNINMTIEEYCRKNKIRYDLPLEIKARMGNDSAVSALIHIYNLFANNDGDALFALARKTGSSIGPPKKIVDKLIYVGTDTCLVYLISQLNAPVYNYRENSYGGHTRTRNMKYDIIYGLRKHFPEEPTLNLNFDQYFKDLSDNYWEKKNKNQSANEYVKGRLKIQEKYGNLFERWAYNKYKIKPKTYLIPKDSSKYPYKGLE